MYTDEGGLMRTKDPSALVTDTSEATGDDERSSSSVCGLLLSKRTLFSLMSLSSFRCDDVPLQFPALRLEDGFFRADGGIGGASVETPLEIFLGGCLDDCLGANLEYGAVAVTVEVPVTIMEVAVAVVAVTVAEEDEVDGGDVCVIAVAVADADGGAGDSGLRAILSGIDCGGAGQV